MYTRKRLKKSHNLTEKVWTIIFIPICSILASILFQFIFASFFLVRPSWGSDKSPRKSSPFFEFSRIIAYKISIDLVLLWCKLFLVLLPRSWMVLVFLPRSPKIFLDFFPRSWKILQNLANFAKNNCQDLGKKISKIQEFFWQENQDAKHLERILFCSFVFFMCLFNFLQLIWTNNLIDSSYVSSRLAKSIANRENKPILFNVFFPGSLPMIDFEKYLSSNEGEKPLEGNLFHTPNNFYLKSNKSIKSSLLGWNFHVDSKPNIDF